MFKPSSKPKASKAHKAQHLYLYILIIFNAYSVQEGPGRSEQTIIDSVKFLSRSKCVVWSLNQLEAVKLTSRHCLVYVIRAACVFSPWGNSEECPQLIKPKKAQPDLIKTHLPAFPVIV